MFFVLSLISSALLLLSPAEETVLVRVEDAPETAHEVVLGWVEVTAAEAKEHTRSVPNAPLDLLGSPHDEPLYDQQWALETMGMEGAWPLAVGNASIVVAVVDSGVDFAHPDLADNIYVNPAEIPDNGIDDDGNGYVDDVSGWDVVDADPDPTDAGVGHGTQVAAVAVAAAEGTGMVGVAPGATLLPVRACSNQCLLFDVAAGMEFAIESGADIIVLSLGGFAQPGPLADALDLAQERGILVVAAAGNGGADIDGTSFVPATLPNPNLASVAATDRHDRLWGGSNTGRETVDIGAPGVELLTATLVDDGSFATVTGTSFSAPHLAGVAALILEVRPGITPAEIILLAGHHGVARPDLASATVFGTRLAADLAVGAARWTDIDGSIFDRDIVALGLAGLTSGCNPPANNHYCPDRPVTRAEMATFLTRALDLAAGPDVFNDDTTSIHHAAINSLAHAGITHGCNPPANDHYCPTRPVTRAEMAAFLIRSFS